MILRSISSILVVVLAVILKAIQYMLNSKVFTQMIVRWSCQLYG